MSAVRDPYLELPLTGVHAIEASAGTGKTFTLATLVLRLVVEAGHRIDQVLAVTFTEAATQELRARIRARLLLALALVDAAPGEDATPEQTLTRAVIAARLASGAETPAALRRRLREAADGIDLAAIFTIHGFCMRVLREHALETGHGFDAPELLANDLALREALAADLWRAHGVEADAADHLLALWKQGPAALAGDLSPLLRERELRPALGGLPPDPAPALRVARAALAAAFREHGEGFRADLLAALQAKVLNGNSYKAAWIDELFDAARAWAQTGDADTGFAHPKLDNLLRETLLDKTSKAGAGRTPHSPICDALPPYLEAQQALAAWRDACRLQLLHRLRDDARNRYARHKRDLRVQTYDDLIDHVAEALEGEDARVQALVARLRAQYRVALVDEFQDTDPRQWAIFARVFGGASGDPALYLIGDPKQAIYGFRGGDVETYLLATREAKRAPDLRHNFRSRPSLLAAIDALYAQAGTAAFVDARIAFHPIQPGGRHADTAFLRDGKIAPALTVWRAPLPPTKDKGERKDYNAGRSRELCTDACVAEIHALLADARAGRANIAGKPVHPGDIAVLVRSHRDATRIRQALAAVGIPAVAAGKQSLYASEEARDVHALLLALLHGDDDGRLRTALSGVLLGQDAAAIAALDTDGEAMRGWRTTALQWRHHYDRGGPLALLGDLCAQAAPRLLGLLDGERRLTNYLQLAELLQEQRLQALGLPGLVDMLARAIADASDDDEAQLLRLESDARRVQIVTLHKSKGLEYPIVLLPYAGIGGKPRDAGQHVAIHDGEQRVLQWNLLDTGAWAQAKAQWQQAQQAEDARLLYVGLTRAQHALWLASGRFYQHAKSPLEPMLADLDALKAGLGDALRIDDAAPPARLPWLPPEATEQVQAPRSSARNLRSDWWVYSFSQLARAEAGSDATQDTASAATVPASGGRDEPDAVEGLIEEPRFAAFAGNCYGVALHAALEESDFAAWRGWRPGDPAPAAEAALIARALRREGYGEEQLADGIELTTRLIGQTLTVRLPEGARLCEVPAQERRPEIEFQFALQPTRVDAMLALLHAHGVVHERRGFGQRQRLEGLMTGLVDLTYRVDGKWYVLDYKSNRLPGYGQLQLQEAMAHSEYDLQALIYTLALHRWLRFRLRDGYDYARDFGGIRYLFCRGLDASRADSPGIHQHRFDPRLVHALDALFGHADREDAA